MELGILTQLIFLPLVGAGLVLLIPRARETWLKIAALATTVAVFALNVKAWPHFQGIREFEWVESISWIPAFNIFYRLGVDGVSWLLVTLTNFLMPVVLLATWNSIQNRLKSYLILLLVLQTGMLGAFCALDLFLFYVFWELMLIPMYFLIGVWGSGRKIMAAFKFILYTMVGSVLMLIAILYGYSKAGQSFFYLDWLKVGFLPAEQFWLFLAFALAFAIKVPVWPFHTWLPDAHTEAPTAGSVILAGVLLKMGTYGFFRYAMPFFPDAAHFFTPGLLVLACLGIVYGSLVAMVQPDIKRLVAYSSVAHLGFVMLGLFAFNQRGVEGAVLQMINHGLSTGALFILIGMIYDRRHTRLIADYGGIAKILPIYSFFFVVITLASIGLPGLNNFVGEFLVLLGAFQANRWGAAVAVLGVILGAVYMLWMVERVFFGKLRHEANKTLKDLNFREVSVLALLVLAMLWVGVYPKPLLSKLHASTEVFLQLTGKTKVAGQ